MHKGTLRAKFLLSLALISALLTSATLLLVRYRVQIHVRDEITQALRNSVVTFQSLEQQRESTLERSSALLATLPPLKAVMTSRDTATIQDASEMFWDLSGSQLFVLADRSGTVVAVHTAMPGFTRAEAQESMRRSLAKAESQDWWFGGGHLFEVFLQPIYFGSPDNNAPAGMLAVGYSVDENVAADVSRVASSQVAFRYENNLVVSTVPVGLQPELMEHLERFAAKDAKPEELQLGPERFLATSFRLSSGNSPAVMLTVLKSYDEATAFLQNLNRWIAGVGLAGVLAGSMLVFLVSTTFTRPLAQLVAGVRALEEGNFAYPLNTTGNDEVSTLTAAFQRMRVTLQDTQRKLLDAERLATIGRMASTISHDLRHPLTAILAYAEFLSESNLSEAQRKDFYQEIRIAVNRMTDEINSLLGFSKQREALKPSFGRVEEVIERAIQTVKALPEFESIAITFSYRGECAGWFDPGKLERVILNLLFNACEAVSPNSGKIEVSCSVSDQGIEIRVTDNGPGIPDAIRENLFQPFVSYGKEKGIGLGLTAVHKIMKDHGGEVSVEHTGPNGTVFKLFFPTLKAAETLTKAHSLFLRSS
jgi:signal transduction histidine kinase